MASKFLLWTIRVLTFCIALVSVLPEVPSGQWWIMLWEFPRLQLAWALLLPLVLLAVHSWWKRPRKEHAVWLGIILAAGIWQLSHILPFTPVWQTEVPDAETHPNNAGATFKVMTANVTYTNDHYSEVLELVRREDPDLVLMLEINSEWNEGLAPLNERYAHRIGEVRGEGLGMVLWSKFPLLEQEVKYLVSERRPSIFATLDIPGIGPVRYVGIHPVPPGLRDRIARNDQTSERRDSRVRDAELMLVAREVEKDADNRWIVTGDFNDVAWSDTTQLFSDLTDLKDPRRGRRLLSTYHAQRPLWRYPIDHLFVSDGFHLADFGRQRVFGSDHFAITATLSVANKDMAKPRASEEEEEKAKEMVEEGFEDAAEHEVSTSQPD
ncbi:endonuclease/exonuclease/phosphatase (EEP) superfamily protein YafD [Modicisalibacter xianhensis]|uniref:Endonuclease/exonuclease/phosphatase (EEP) superfamily protein YafD n=1 Tax=Modicisalibacter xianhensis TaxID=442341 RepID=A0A4R8FYR7_9GAMM|nr:endonuclease/exonuclease/phosphatase family protein [Halomonas xianhensis]TDX32207.1 endonuclease/exonuclease/phosphatase (EEP) superfamily protein YafD [Halomonas xianhensis]